MSTAIERLQGTLNTLGLKAVELRLENLLEQASKKEPSYADFLEELLGCEVDARRSRYLINSTSAFSRRLMKGRSGSCVRCGSCMKPVT